MNIKTCWSLDVNQESIKWKTRNATLSEEELEDTKEANQNPFIEEGQTTQWPNEINKRTNNFIQNITNKTKDRVTWTSIKYGGEKFQNPIGKSYEEAK